MGVNVRAVVILVSIVLTFDTADADAQISCPPDTQHIFSGETTGVGSSTPIDISIPTEMTSLEPCQTLGVTVSTSDNHQLYGAGFQFEIFNSSGVRLNWIIWSSLDAHTKTLPLAENAPPYRATRGAGGRHYNAVFRVSASPSVTVSYVITLVKMRRPQHNLGGDSFTNAPQMIPDTAYMGTLHPLETADQGGQYYRVQLAAGTSALLTGSISRLETSGGSAIFKIVRFDSSQSNPATLVNTLVGATNSPKAFSASFTNLTSSVQEYFLRLSAESRSIQDFSLTVSGALQPPRLSLFLDADGNFEQNGQNDAAAYVPATVFTTGASVPTMPEGTPLQQIRVIAAWVNDSNQIIAPPSWSQDVAFWMEKTSAFKGYAMNAGSSEDADFLLVDSTAGFQSNLAVGHINVFDYGGRTEINAATGGQMAVIKIPLAGEDWIPEAGWKVYANGELLSEVSALGLVAGADADAAPTGNGTNGDGLRVFEEYRGFVVRDEHRRTDPATKDLFIDSTTAVNIGWAINLSVTKHFVWETQLLGDREINTNFMNAGPQGDVPNHSTQRGIVVRENNYLGEGVYGETWPVSGLTWNADCPSQDPLNPNKTLIALLYTKAIREHSPTYTNPFPNAQDVEDSADPAAQKKTVGHEIGHAVGMCHYSYVPSEGGLTVMVSGFLDFADAAWSNIPSTYDPTDNNQLRLK